MVSSITGLSVKEYTLFWIVSHPLQHLVNDWPKVTAQQFTFPKFPQGLTTTMIKDSGVFLMPNLKQSFNISPPPPEHFSDLLDTKVHWTISRVREVLFCISRSSLTIVHLLAEHPMGSPAPFTLIKGLRAIKETLTQWTSQVDSEPAPAAQMN